MEHRRWYDQDRSCPRMLEQLREIDHPLIQEFCARVLINIAEKIKRVIDLEKPYLKIGRSEAEAMNYMHRFGNQKQRWYDAHPVMDEAVNELYNLPPQGLSAVSFHLAETFNLIQIYATVCQNVGHEPTYEELARIALVSLQLGAKEAEHVLVKLVGQARFDIVKQQLMSGEHR